MAKRAEKSRAQVRKETKSTLADKEAVPGPSTNPATNLLISDIVMRSGGRVMRMALEKGMLRSRFDPQLAKDIVENRTLVNTLVTYGISKVATRSLPGAALVGGGLLVKTLFDRSQSRRAARKAGDKTIAKAVKPK